MTDRQDDFIPYWLQTGMPSLETSEIPGREVMFPWEYPWPHTSRRDMWAEATASNPSVPSPALPFASTSSWPSTASPFGADLEQPAPHSASKTRVNALLAPLMQPWEYPWPHTLPRWVQSTQPNPSAAPPLEHLDSGKYWGAGSASWVPPAPSPDVRDRIAPSWLQSARSSGGNLGLSQPLDPQWPQDAGLPTWGSPSPPIPSAMAPASPPQPPPGSWNQDVQPQRGRQAGIARRLWEEFNDRTIGGIARDVPKIARAVADLPGNLASSTLENFHGGIDTMRRGAEEIGSGRIFPRFPSSDARTWEAGGVLRSVGGGLGTIFSPITAATEHLIENPVTQLTGNPEIGSRAGVVANTMGLRPFLPRGAKVRPGEKLPPPAVVEDFPAATPRPAVAGDVPVAAPQRVEDARERAFGASERPAPKLNDAGPRGYAPQEAVPGEITKHLSGTLNQPYEWRQKYTGSGWINPQTGGDAIAESMNIARGSPTLPATGSYRALSGNWETQPAHTGRWTPELTPDGLELSPRSKSLIEAAERTRAVMDGQEAGAYNVWIRDAPEAHRTSVDIPHSGPLDPTKAEGLGPLADRHGFYMSDRGDGVSLIAKRPAHGGPQTKEDTAGLLGGELGQGIRDRLPGAVPTPTRMVSDIVEGIGRPPGKGQATKAWLDTLDLAPPEAIEGLGRSGLVRDMIAGLHARDARLHGTMGPEGELGTVQKELQHLRDTATRNRPENWLAAVRAAYRANPEAFPAVLLPLVAGPGAHDFAVPGE